MGSPETRTVGLIGCGAQGVSQLHALLRVFDINKVLFYDVGPAATESFPQRISFANLDGVQVQSCPLQVLVRSSDIICTATTVEVGKGPVFEDTGCKPWVHINAVGADFPGKTELPTSLLKRSFVCPDFLEQSIKEGECQRLRREDIGPSLAELEDSKP